MSSFSCRCLFAVALLAVASVALPFRALAADEWNEPKDGVFTEKQITNFIGAEKDLMQMLKAMGKAAEGSKSGAGMIALMAGLDDKINAILAKHDLKRAEYDWLNQKVFECWGLSLIDDAMEKGQADLAEQKKKNAADVEAGKVKVAEYEKASKEGKRVLTKEQREQLTQSAKDAQASAADEAKQHAQEAKEAADEASKAEAEAKAADALAKNPPSDVDKDSREDYVKGKKEEAENLRNNAKEARDREKEARKAEAESKAKVAAAAKQMASPEVPVTDEEKAQVKQENEQGLASAKSDLETAMQAGQFIADAEVNFKKQMAESHKDVKEENLKLVKKHNKELQEAMGMDEKK
jgi:hypothetical protein